MKIIIPMAGLGKRMRPHTLTTPKPLIHLAGKSIVEHLVGEIASAVAQPIEEIAFVMGHFGPQAEEAVRESARRIGAESRIYYQEEPLGTAHAILCAAPSLNGPVVVAFADTIFYCSKPLDLQHDSIIWTKEVEDPSSFGVVLTDSSHKIKGFIEKPQTAVSNQAIIGIYFFKDGENLKNELQYLIDHDIRKGMEYQLTDALQNMMEKGLDFFNEPVDEWLDCGNKDATVATHTRVLEHQGHYVAPEAVIEDSVILPPCHIAAGVRISHSVVGPYVSIGNESRISNSILQESILQKKVQIENALIRQSMIGNEAGIRISANQLSLGDFSHFEC